MALFNSISGQIEHDTVFCVLFAPITAEGKEKDESKSIAEQIAEGQMEVHEQYQTLQHGIVDAGILFGSDEECKEYYRELFAAL